MNLFKTSFYTSLSTAVTLICSFIVAKVVAVKIGPAGIAMVGQFQNTTSILSMLGIGAINMGVVKYLSENRNNQQQQQSIIATAIVIVSFSSFIVAVFVIFSARWFSKLSFHTPDFWIVYLLYGFFIVFASFNTIFLAIYNGLKEIKKLTIVNIFFSVAGIIFTVLFAENWGVKGVLCAVNATAVTVFILNCLQFSRLQEIRLSLSFKKIDLRIVQQLFRFSLMSSVSAIVLPASQFTVRNRIISIFSVNEAGYWQGVTRISDYYLSFITTVLSVYYLPTLSETVDKKELRTEIVRGYKIILPVVGLLALLIWIFRHFIILVLFSKQFLPMENLFAFQLIGDFLKISSWLLGFLMWAKALTKTFIVSEVLFGIFFVALSYYMINVYGIVGATYAFAANYLFYFIAVTILMKKYIL